MALNAISATQPLPQNVYTHSPQKTSGEGAKTTTLNAAESGTAAAKAPQAAANAENNAGRGQSQGQNAESHAGGTTGTHVNLYA
jgi:hypothetical protein